MGAGQFAATIGDAALQLDKLAEPMPTDPEPMPENRRRPPQLMKSSPLPKRKKTTARYRREYDALSPQRQRNCLSFENFRIQREFGLINSDGSTTAGKR